MSDATLIPRKAIFGNPDRAAVKLSPDGAYLSFLAPLEGVLNIWVAPSHDPSQAKAITHDTERGIRNYHWAYTSQDLFYLQDNGGDENWHVYCVNLTDQSVCDLTPVEGVSAHILHRAPTRPQEVIIGINDRKPEYYDPYVVNIHTAERTLILENNHYTGFVFDEQYQPQIAVQPLPDGGTRCLKRQGQDWELLANVKPEDTLATDILKLNKDATLLYVHDTRERNTAGLYSIELASGERTLICDDIKADIETTLFHPVGQYPQAAASHYTKREWHVLDEGLKEDFAQLEHNLTGSLAIESRSQDENMWVVRADDSDKPMEYYLYTRQDRTLKHLFSGRSALVSQPLVPMHPYVISSRDGLELVSYLSLPQASDPDATGKPSAPLPMVLYVHGGPWARDYWGYEPIHQWLANRGYAVLSVNYRGSKGFGKDFINAANGEFAGKMHDDLIDAVDWAIGEGIAQADKVAIMGGSYGGYATLVGLTFTPEVFVAGVDIVGPSNLVTLVESFPSYWTPLLEGTWYKRVGDPRTEEGKKALMALSPITRVDAITKPLLIGQGENDPRVTKGESDQISEAMQAKGLAVTYINYPDEGHGFARPENRRSFFAITENFLAPILGGRAEGIGEAFEGSSLQILADTTNIPGLQKALAEV